MHKIMLMALMAGILSGCHFAANSQDELRSEPASKYEFDAAVNYQAAYKQIADMLRQCHTGSAWGTALLVEADLMPDLRRGTVALTSNQFGTQYIATSEITPTQDGKAHVVVWNWLHSWDKLGPEFEKWANGGTAC